MAWLRRRWGRLAVLVLAASGVLWLAWSRRRMASVDFEHAEVGVHARHRQRVAAAQQLHAGAAKVGQRLFEAPLRRARHAAAVERVAQLHRRTVAFEQRDRRVVVLSSYSRRWKQSLHDFAPAGHDQPGR